ncbi:YdeI/OmpD-associated family protein [Streptomyces sp. NPDC051907]|uniref:YdeI/OmpD-associated family protein n=1 Tax=Streptomyces sp. NPDC051907 TaxID=3155284 RepID=UPI00341AC759
MDSLDSVEIIVFEDEAALEAWMAEHYERESGVWLKIAKKGSGVASVTITQALDVALCYGWIDGQRKSFDATYYLQKYTPRRPRSLWSQVNIRKVEALDAAGRMKAPGLAAVAAAKSDGRWDAAYASQREATVPEDLAAALEESHAAKSAFERLGKSARYSVVFPLMTARTPATRAQRLRRAIAALEKGETGETRVTGEKPQ